ncbi:chorismate mutase [Micromonospora sp. NPDC047670]|uniref:chorismate mutase n=1 Tax=Micromonospora sp. NPDC047670 TaxID=3364252 RepID=UPI00371ACA5F
MCEDFGMAETATALAEIRAAIDQLDDEIVRLLARRESLVRRAAPLKTDLAAVRAPDRVAQVIARIRTSAAEAGATPDVMERIYRGIIQTFIDMETDEHRRNTGA